MKFDHDKILSAVREGWSWAIADPSQILAVNSMANVFLRDSGSRFWRICPEELSAKVEAQNESEVREVFGNPKYKADWQLLGLIDPAEEQLGLLGPGQCYGIKQPCVIGGEYSVSNLRVADTYEYLRDTGYLASQIKDLPDRTHVELVPAKG